MATLLMEEKRNRLLLALYELSTTKSPHVDVDELEKLTDVGPEFYDLLRDMGSSGRNWLKKSNLVVRITSTGTDKAEDLLKMQIAEKQQRMVLEKIYEMGGPDHIDEVSFHDLQEALEMEHRLLTSILDEFENSRGWLGAGSDEGVRLTPAGIREYESPSSDSVGNKPTYQNIFHGPFQGGIQQGGASNVQNNRFTNNPTLDENVRMLIEVIRASNLNALDKDDFVHDVERIKQLAQQTETPGAVERAQNKLEAVKTALEVADKSGELLGKALPYITVLWHLLTTLNS
jgi:hypothetical protein